MAILKTGALAVLALAVSIGVIGKTKPSLFLKLPMGFIPWCVPCLVCLRNGGFNPERSALLRPQPSRHRA